MTTREMALVVVCFLPCGRRTFIALGATIVLVIIKNMSSKKIMSVIDDILKVGVILVLLFNINPFLLMSN